MEGEEQMKNNMKGITLIALIITIIILLILAVVTIGSIKDSNIITYAQNATDKYETEKLKEESILGQYEDEISKYNNTNEATIERIYYVIDEKWSNVYVTSKSQVPEEATITAKFYKTNTTIQPDLSIIFGEEASQLSSGYAYKLVIDGAGEVPIIMDEDEGSSSAAAWGKEIGEFIDGKEITPIAFYVTEAEVKGVSNVGMGAFAYNISLSKLKLNESVEKTNSYAFAGTLLESINLENVTNIEQYSFAGASKLKYITLSEVYTTVEANSFSKSLIENIDLKYVTKIADYAFRKCSNLKSIILENVTEIGKGAFDECNNLTSVKINKTASEIKAMANYPWSATGKIYDKDNNLVQ